MPTNDEHGGSNGVDAVPTVSVGIPVLNGAATLGRALDSILDQTLSDLEIVISDNASSDNTPQICREYSARDRRIRYTRQRETVCPNDNFTDVLQRSRGRLFMWLGHDDWLDRAYLRRCADAILQDADVALASGATRYYEGDTFVRNGARINLTSADARLRVLHYLARAQDNGAFYGLMRRELPSRLPLPHVIGADQLYVASLAFVGKVVCIEDVCVHRSLGGISRSYADLAAASHLSSWQGRFPRTTRALGAFSEIAWNSRAYDRQRYASRLGLATVASALLLTRGIVRGPLGLARRLAERARRRVH